MLAPILFLGGLSGAGKSTVMKWVAAEMHFLPLEIDLEGPSGIDVYGLRHEWNCFSSQLDPAPLADAIRLKIASANCSGAVLSFPSDAIFNRDRINLGRRVGIHTVIMFGPVQLCIDAFLKREQTNGRGLDEKYWHLKNDPAVAVYGESDYDDCRFNAFSADGTRCSREYIVKALSTWLPNNNSLDRR